MKISYLFPPIRVKITFYLNIRFVRKISMNIYYVCCVTYSYPYVV